MDQLTAAIPKKKRLNLNPVPDESECQVEIEPRKTCWFIFARLRNVETIKVHHLVPGPYKVVDELLLRVRTSVDFGQGPELGI